MKEDINIIEITSNGVLCDGCDRPIDYIVTDWINSVFCEDCD